MEDIVLFKSYSDEEDIKGICEVIKRGTFWADGPEIKEFETLIKEYTGHKHAISFNSGTTALYTMLLAYKSILKIQKGEVIVPSFTFPATINAVLAAGLTPIFADIEDKTFSLSAKDVEKKITPDTKIILPIHFGGNVSSDIIEIQKLAKEKNIILLEDNAHSIGATQNGKMAGTFGDSAMISCCFNKTLPTGEGGFILTNNDEVAEFSKLFRAHGKTNNPRDYITFGLNFRLPTVLAALGITQIKKLNFLINERRKIAENYNQTINKLKGITIPFVSQNVFCTYQMYNLIFENKEERDNFIAFAKENKIPTRVTYEPVHNYSFYKNEKNIRKEGLIVTEDIASRIITIPMYVGLTSKQQQHILEKIKEFSVDHIS